MNHIQLENDLMGIKMQQDLTKINELVQWIRENARVSKALSHPAGVTVFRDIVNGKVNSLIDHVKSLGRSLLETSPANSEEIKQHGQVIIDTFSNYRNILMNPQLNVARAFHQSGDELQHLLLKTEEFLRFAPAYQHQAVDVRQPTLDETAEGMPTDEPSISQLFTDSPPEGDQDLPQPHQYTYVPSYSPMPPPDRLPPRPRRDFVVTPPTPPPPLPPRDYSDIPILDKVLDLQHEVEVLRQANKYLKDQCNYWQKKVVEDQPGLRESENTQLRAELTRLQSEIRDFEEERQMLLGELQDIKNTVARLERGDRPNLAPLHEKIRNLIIDNYSIRKEATQFAFQRIEQTLSSLQSQIELLINENRELRANLSRK